MYKYHKLPENADWGLVNEFLSYYIKMTSIPIISDCNCCSRSIWQFCCIETSPIFQVSLWAAVIVTVSPAKTDEPI